MNNKVFRHYKGGIYVVVGIGKHTENNERLVAYVDSEGAMHFRPFNMFFGKVMFGEEEVERFSAI